MLGDLHGIPVGIKDIFDTEDMPTLDGSEAHKKNPSLNDCTCLLYTSPSPRD